MIKDFVFVSGNLDKVRMLEKLLGYSVEHHELDLPEIQSLDMIEVVEAKAKAAYKILKRPVLIDDVALSIPAMGDLPGTFVKFFLKAVGGEGICKMVDTFGDRSATATTIFVLYDGQHFHTFTGVVKGSVSSKPRGDLAKLSGMGWNPIFIPEGQSKTLAEIGIEQFAKHTPRAKAVQKLKAFLDEK